MVERRPTPHDTPDSTTKNGIVHYAGLAVITIIVIGLIVYLVS